MKFLSNILVKAGLVVEGTTDLQGTATTITQSSSDSSTKIATTAFVKNQGYAVGNVYTTDGSLSGNRTINLNGSYLDIAGLTTTRFFANGNVVIDGASPVDAGFKLDVAGTGRYTGILYANSRLNVNGATDSVNYQLNVTGRIRSSGQMESGAQVYGATGGIFNGVGIGAKTFTGPGYNYDTNNWIVASNSTTQPWAFYITNVQGINSISSRGAIIRFALTTTAGVEAGITNIQNNSDFAYVQFSGQYTTTAFGTQGEVYRVNRIDGQITDANARLFSWVGHTISPVLSSGLSNATIRGYFYNPTLTVTPANNIAFEATSGIMKLGNLAGTGTRMVVADSSGVLSTQAIPSGNAGTVTSIATTGPITGGTITSSGTIGITQATTSTDGYLSSTDWNTFNNKQAALGFTPVTNARTITINGTTFDLTANRSWSVGNLTGSLTSGYIPKATGSSSLADGLIYDTGSAVLIGTQTASSAKFMVYSTSPDNHYQAVGSAPSFRFADTINSPSYTGIFGLATASNHFIIGAAAGDMVLSNNTTSAIGNFIFGTGATERMRISPAGNVSINNTNNTYRFDVNGTVRFTGQLRLESTITNGTHTYTLPSATGTLALTSQLTGGTVTSVGLSSATSGVTIGSSPITTSGTITLAIATASGSGQGLLSSTDWTTFNNKQNALTNPVTGTGTTNYLPKFTGTSTIGNSVIVDNGGNIGINTASSAVELAVYSTSTARIQVQNSTTGVAFNDGFQFAISGSDGYVWNFENANIIFGTNNTAKMRLDASGNLGLGVTPSAGGLGGYVLFELANGGASIYSGANQSLIGTNASWSGGTASYKISNFATLYNQQSGQHQWFNAPSGTAGNAISFTQAMTLDASGNLLLGTTSPLLSSSGRGNITINGSSSSILAFGIASALSGYIYSSSSNLELDAGGARFMQFNTNNTERMRITSGGVLAVGKSDQSGNAVLTVKSPAGGNTGIIMIEGDTTNNGWGMYATTADNYVVTRFTNGSYADYFTIASTGAATFSSTVRVEGSYLQIANATNPSLYINNTSVQWQTYVKSNSNYAISDAVRDVLTLGYNGSASYFNGCNVGIGTTSPSTKLHIGGVGSAISFDTTGATATSIIQTVSDFELSIKNNRGTSSEIIVGNEVLSFKTNSAERMRITSGGNVGIGTTSPAQALTVSRGSSSAYIQLIGQSSNLYLGQDSAGAAIISDRDAPMYFQVGASERLRITSGGNVGIGTTSPDRALTVNGQIGINNDFVSTKGGQVFRIGYEAYTSTGGVNLFTEGAIPLVLGTSSTERMRITSGGNVGIGTTSPGRRLEVYSATSDTRIAITNSISGSGAGAGFELLVNNADAYAYNYMTGHMIFGTSSTERMRITSGGNVVIGGTNAASRFNVRGQNSNSQIEFDNFGSGVNYILSYDRVAAAYKDIVLITNASNNTLYASTSGNVGIGTTSPATKLHVSNNGAYGIEIDVANEIIQAYNRSTSDYNEIKIYSSNLRFFNGTSSTITERMRITSSGNVGIGTTSPGQRLTADAPFGQPATTGTTQNGVFRIQVDQGAGWGEVLDMGMHVGISGPPSYAWLQGTNKGNHGINYNIAINPRGGNVGIGTTSPTNYISGTETSLHVYNSNAATLNLASGGGNIYSISSISGNHLIFFNASTGSERMRINGVGDVLINTTSAFASGKLCVNGIGAFGGVYSASLGTGSVFSNAGNLTNTNPSDLRLKNTIKPLTYGLNEVLQLNPKTFYYNDDATRARLKYGFIAQEVKEVMPDLVRRLGSDNDYLGLETEGIYVALVNAIKELKQELDILKNK